MSKPFVYFIKPVGMDGPIKIGCSAVPENRLISLSVWSPVALEILVTIPGSIAIEQTIHAKFEEHHSHKEWFNPAPEILDLIAKLKAGIPLHEAVDLSGLKRKSIARNWTEEHSKRRSYHTRTNAAARRIRKGYGNRPAQIDAIMRQWSGYGRQPQVTPSPEQIALLEDFIANPGAYMLDQQALAS